MQRTAWHWFRWYGRKKLKNQLKPYYMILNNTKDREVRIWSILLTEVDFQNWIVIVQPSIKIFSETILALCPLVNL